MSSTNTLYRTDTYAPFKTIPGNDPFFAQGQYWVKTSDDGAIKIRYERNQITTTLECGVFKPDEQVEVIQLIWVKH